MSGAAGQLGLEFHIPAPPWRPRREACEACGREVLLAPLVTEEVVALEPDECTGAAPRPAVAIDEDDRARMLAGTPERGDAVHRLHRCRHLHTIGRVPDRPDRRPT